MICLYLPKILLIFKLMILIEIIIRTILFAPYATLLLEISAVCLIIHSSCFRFVEPSLRLLTYNIHLSRPWTILIKLIVIIKSSISKLSVIVIWRRLCRLSCDSAAESHHHFKKCFWLLAFYLLHLNLFIYKSWAILNIAPIHRLAHFPHRIISKLLVLQILTSKHPRIIVILFHCI